MSSLFDHPTQTHHCLKRPQLRTNSTTDTPVTSSAIHIGAYRAGDTGSDALDWLVQSLERRTGGRTRSPEGFNPWLRGELPDGLYKLMHEFEHMRRSFWGSSSRGYFCCSSGNVTDEVITECIENQGQEEDVDFEVDGET